MQNEQQATDLQSLRTIVFISLFLSILLAFVFAGAAIYSLDFTDKQEAQANANFVKEESNWSFDFTLLNVKFKKGGDDE